MLLLCMFLSILCHFTGGPTFCLYQSLSFPHSTIEQTEWGSQTPTTRQRHFCLGRKEGTYWSGVTKTFSRPQTSKKLLLLWPEVPQMCNLDVGGWHSVAAA